jgi:predicted O-linked N-acetylglucosamine transferase (SPINDLY family)
MCPGHPATTHSDCIDYIVSDGDLFGDESLYSEKCVGLPVGTVRYINSSKIDRSKFVKTDVVFGGVPIHFDNATVRIAVSAMAMKLVPPFLKAMKEINERVTVPVEWHIFPNMIAMFHHLITADLQKWVPNAVVHPRMTYSDYMNTLGKCDVFLSSFPFCGTNSVIDAFLCNMPVVAMEGTK